MTSYLLINDGGTKTCGAGDEKLIHALV
jgi:hypothetical protein